MAAVETVPPWSWSRRRSCRAGSSGLEKHQFRGIDYEAQAEAIRRVCDRYNVTYIGIDRTGIGDAVYQLVSKSRPDARALPTRST
jgi:hypothetical protein